MAYPTLINRREVTATNGTPAVVMLQEDAKCVSAFGKGGGKIEKTVSSAEEIAAGTADWIEAVAAFVNPDYDDSSKVVLGDETVVALRISYVTADATMVVLWR